jgi:Rrf2 family protein
MNLLARDTDYAIRALLYAADQAPRRVSTAELEKELGLPRPFMRKICQMLQKESFLDSVKGVNGGFTLALAPERIRLADLMAVFQGKVSLGDCLFRKKLCHCVASCPLRREIKDIEGIVLKKLKAVTLAGLQEREKR